MSMQALKELNLDRVLDNDGAVWLSAEARLMEQEFAALGQAVPEWLEKSATILREEIARRNRASVLEEMKRVERELEGLKTANERKQDAQRRLAALQKQLGMSAKA